MTDLQLSAVGALPSGFTGAAMRGTGDEPVPRFCKGLYKHLPCLPVVKPRDFAQRQMARLLPLSACHRCD